MARRNKPTKKQRQKKSSRGRRYMPTREQAEEALKKINERNKKEDPPDLPPGCYMNFPPLTFF